MTIQHLDGARYVGWNAAGDQIVIDRRRSFFRDIILPGLGIIGSIASVGLLLDRISENR